MNLELFMTTMREYERFVVQLPLSKNENNPDLFNEFEYVSGSYIPNCLGVHKGTILVAATNNAGTQVYDPVQNKFARTTNDLYSNWKQTANAPDGTLYMWAPENSQWINSGYTNDTWAFKLLRYNDNNTITAITTDDNTLINVDTLLVANGEIYLSLKNNSSYVAVSKSKWIYKLDTVLNQLVKAISLEDVDPELIIARIIDAPDAGGWYYFACYKNNTVPYKVFRSKFDGTDSKEYLFDVPAGFSLLAKDLAMPNSRTIFNALGFYLIATGNDKSWIMYPVKSYKYYVRKFRKWCPILENGTIIDE